MSCNFFCIICSDLLLYIVLHIFLPPVKFIDRNLYLQSQISGIRRAGDGFFNLPVDVKSQFTRPSDGRNFGWVSLERER